MKRTLCFIIACMFLLVSVQTSFASTTLESSKEPQVVVTSEQLKKYEDSIFVEDSIRIVIDNKEVIFSTEDQVPYKKNDVIMVPARLLANQLNIRLTTKNEKGKMMVTLSKDSKELSFTAGGGGYYLNQTIYLPLALHHSEMKKDTLFVPVEFIANVFGYQYTFISSTSVVNLESEEYAHIDSYVSDKLPTLFIHGWNGSGDTFATMLHYLTYNKETKKPTNPSIKDTFNGQGFTYFIQKNGKLLIEDYKVKNQNKYLIKVIFENNNASLANQTEWLKTVLNDVKTRFKTDKVNVVAHSMGGLATIKYVEDYNTVKINKFVTLGTPVLGSKVSTIGTTVSTPPLVGKPITTDAIRDLSEKSEAIQSLNSKKNKAKFDRNIYVFSIAGSAFNSKLVDVTVGDNVVSLDSAFGLKTFTDEKHFKSMKFEYYNHSELHEKPIVMDNVANFLWN